jgi:hypothetical protein
VLPAGVGVAVTDALGEVEGPAGTVEPNQSGPAATAVTASPTMAIAAAVAIRRGSRRTGQRRAVGSRSNPSTTRDVSALEEPTSIVR